MAESLNNQIITVFNRWGVKLVRDTKKAIDDAIATDGGGQNSNLSGSVDYKVLSKGNEIWFQLTMNDYWKFVDNGVDGTKKNWGSKYKFKGKNINQQAVLNFIKKRHIRIDISPTRKTKIKGVKNKGIKKAYKQMSLDAKRRSLAFVIGRSIAEEGLKPTHFMDEVITEERKNELKTMLKPLIEKSYILDIKSALE